MKKILALTALTFSILTAGAQVTVWSSGKAIYNSQDLQVDSVSFQKLSKAGSNSSNESLGYREVQATYSESDYLGYCNVIIGSAIEGSTGFVPGVSDNNFRWIEIYDHKGKLIESTDQWTGVYRVPHNGWIIPYFQYTLSAGSIVYQKITVGKLDRLKVSFSYNKSNFFVE